MTKGMKKKYGEGFPEYTEAETEIYYNAACAMDTSHEGVSIDELYKFR